MRRARRNGRPLLAAALAVLGGVLLLTAVPSRASATALSSAVWTVSKTTVAQSNATYTFTLMPATGGSLSEVTMSVPSGITGTPVLAAVTPPGIAGGSVSLAGGVLAYTFAAAPVQAGRLLTIAVSGLGTPLSAGPQASTITTYNGGTAVDTGTASFSFTLAALTGVTWTASSTAPGAAGVSYTYTFTPSSLGSALAIGTITVTVPPGTSGTPGVGASSPPLSTVNSVSLAGRTLTIGYSPGLLILLTPVSITITGLTNSYTAGSFAPEIVTSGSGLLDSAVASATTFTSSLAVGAPAGLSWSGALAGPGATLSDGTAADQQLTVDDATNSAAGWHVTVSATSFSALSGYALPAAGVLDVTGSLSSAQSTAAPTAACLGPAACTLPDDSAVTYPVAVTSAATSPPASTVYDAKAGTGVGAVTLGGSTAAHPVGWWVNVPPTAQTGSYSSVITVTVISGP